MQDKVIQIEEHLIHLEKQFDELNQVIYKQSLKIDELEKSVSSLNDKLDQNQSLESNNQLERPPHY
ncbi:SlyX family protein [Gammaproteobacteria bacterium]|nr:SlyX family protein [Gammaproteobacteria bacterium]